MDMKNLKTALITLGDTNPELREDLRPILASMLSDGFEPLTQNEAFGVIRAALATNNESKIFEAIKHVSSVQWKYFQNVIHPYIQELSQRAVLNAKTGDRLKVVYETNGIKSHQVVILESTEDLKAKGRKVKGIYSIAYAKKPTSEKMGSFRIVNGRLEYQATISAQYQRVLWTYKA